MLILHVPKTNSARSLYAFHAFTRVRTPLPPAFHSTQHANKISCSGGALVVRHQDASLTYDWASNGMEKLQWAAFYSDCEHEVLEVTSGHRITLTYNLIATPGVGMLAGNCPVIDASKSLFYQSMKAYFEHPKSRVSIRHCSMICYIH